MLGLLAAPPQPPEGAGPEWGKAAPIGLLIILLMAAAFFFLMRSMSSKVRRVKTAATQAEAELAERAAAENHTDIDDREPAGDPSSGEPTEARPVSVEKQQPDGHAVT